MKIEQSNQGTKEVNLWLSGEGLIRERGKVGEIDKVAQVRGMKWMQMGAAGYGMRGGKWNSPNPNPNPNPRRTSGVQVENEY